MSVLTWNRVYGVRADTLAEWKGILAFSRGVLPCLRCPEPSLGEQRKSRNCPDAADNSIWRENVCSSMRRKLRKFLAQTFIANRGWCSLFFIYIHRDVGTKWIENLTNWHTKESLLRPNKRSQPNGYQISKILRVIIYSDLSRLSCGIDSIYNQTFNSSKQLFFELNSSTRCVPFAAIIIIKTSHTNPPSSKIPFA